MSRRNGPVAQPRLLVALERSSETTLHEQIEQALREQIRAGRLAPGSRLPSSRGLAAELGVSRGVVTEAYGQLAAEGYLTMRQGATVRVAGAVRAAAARPAATSLAQRFSYDFRPGLPDVTGFPREAWLRSLRAALRHSPLDSLGYPDPRGVPALRETLAAYLGRVRGADAEPEHVVVCTGFMQGLSLLCRALRAQGVERVAVEEPGWHAHRLIVEQSGLEVIAVPVDDRGLCVEALAGSDAAAVIVTPAHQFPTGVVLAPERRAELIEWAEEEQRLIIEDDYDSEYRYDRVAVGTLQGLAPEHVAYVGSASKRLVPGMRLGWMLAPSWLAWELSANKMIEDGGSEVLGQLALADFIARGELDRHIRRMRLRYERRREALLGALQRWLPQARPSRAGAGLFELVGLPPDTSEPALVRAASERGVGVEGISTHRYAAAGDPALLLGYAAMAEPAIERGVRLLGESYAATRP